MSEVLKVGNLEAEPGSKVQGYLDVAGTDIKMPVTLINSGSPGKTVVITGGTHGGEYPGIEAAVRLAAKLSPEVISGRLIIVHPVNVPAFYAKLQYIGPYDGKNLNRMFPGKAMGTASERIAYTVSTELHAKADFLMDLHGGDIHEALTPFVLYSRAAGEELAEVSKTAASFVGVPYVVGSMATTGTYGSAATVHGVPGILIEIGNCGLWSEEEVSLYIRGVENVLKHLGVLEGEADDLCSVTYMPRMVGTSAEQTGLWYPWVKPGQKVKKDNKTGEIRDSFTKVLGEYFAPVDGIVMYVASSLAITSGDPLTSIGEMTQI